MGGTTQRKLTCAPEFGQKKIQLKTIIPKAIWIQGSANSQLSSINYHLPTTNTSKLTSSFQKF
ncbi:MAG: hypothetical protein ABUT20_31305, partial [Bacteroidota bacterium]